MALSSLVRQVVRRVKGRTSSLNYCQFFNSRQPQLYSD